MTAVCGGGTSGPKPGTEISVAVGAAYLAQLLELAEIPWLWPVIPLLVIPPIVVGQFCSSDPPALPTFTQAEATALTQLDVGSAAFQSGLPKAVDLALYYAWYDNCRCTSGTLTPPTTNVTPPNGTTVTLTPTPQASSPCYSTNFFSDMPSGFNNDGVLVTQQAMPVGASQVVFQYSWSVSTPGTLTGTWHAYPVVNGQFRTDLATTNIQYQGNATQGTQTFALPVGTTAMRYVAAMSSGTGDSALNVQESYYCGGAGPGTQTPCCPPDATTQSTLSAILNMVTLIQRQAVPFAYVDGATHANLSGTGVLNVTSLLGVKVLPHSIPPDVGTDPGDPNTYWLDSWINWGNADGFLPRENLRTSPHLSMPPLAGQFTQIGYTLRPGLTVDIVELVRES